MEGKTKSAKAAVVSALVIGGLSFSLAYLLNRTNQTDKLPKQTVNSNAESVPNSRLPETSHAVQGDSARSKIDYTQDERLPPGEEAKFLDEVVDVFATKAMATANSDNLSPYLSELNSRLRRGARSVRTQLETESKSDAEATKKLSYVDYLVYRAKWDPAVQDDIVAIVKAPVTSIGNQRYRATRIAEDMELVKGLATHNFDKAATMVATLDESIQKNYAAAGLHDALVNQGMSWTEANNKIAEFIPNYNRHAR